MSASSATSGIPGQTLCYCNHLGVLRTSWTDSNPGRRFIGCHKWQEAHGCGFFVWFDPPMCERSKMVIPRLLRTLRRVEDEAKRAKKMERRFKTLLMVTWVLCAVVGIWCMI
ncbi:hypothetical protein Vadar_005727 [Vaccinium darrowii]|uniref:Uncharacterized protein n=1 Tax=Vaccinium darrowii TaxID=229202 RepID=A0ACB7Z2T2_9ERIC|nr:hypothetical protein Vadar_005727 [Vaccinium darrowii]